MGDGGLEHGEGMRRERKWSPDSLSKLGTCQAASVWDSPPCYLIKAWWRLWWVEDKGATPRQPRIALTLSNP